MDKMPELPREVQDKLATLFAEFMMDNGIRFEPLRNFVVKLLDIYEGYMKSERNKTLH